jgi:hypothetical protein
MEDFWNYYGLDTAGMFLSLLAVYQLGNKNRWGFVNFMIANAIWIVLGVWFMDSTPMAIGNTIFLIINFRGHIRWIREAKEIDPKNIAQSQ